MIRQVVFVLLAIIAGLTACGDAKQESGTLANALPLDAERLTFVFFYADP